jgi:hypothetical protein
MTNHPTHGDGGYDEVTQDDIVTMHKAADARLARARRPTSGLWRSQEGTREGKYLVMRRDGTVPEWPYFVIGARDPAAPAALRAYADEAAVWRLDPVYVADVRHLADEFEQYRREHLSGDPDAVRHRPDDPETVAKMAGRP